MRIRLDRSAPMLDQAESRRRFSESEGFDPAEPRSGESNWAVPGRRELSDKFEKGCSDPVSCARGSGSSERKGSAMLVDVARFSLASVSIDKMRPLREGMIGGVAEALTR
jgi:hypothetical protein